MKEFIGGVIGTLLVIYFLGSYIAFIAGAIGTNQGCKEQSVRIEALFPIYKLTCWGFSPEENK